MLYISPGAGKTEGYVVDLLNDDGQIIKTETVPATDFQVRHVVKTPLPIGESFTARVRSESAGRMSNAVDDEFYVEDPPVEGVQFLNVGKTTAELKWAKGNAEKFRIQILLGETVIQNYDDILEPSYLLTDLDHNENYTVMVQGFDARDRMISRASEPMATKPLMVRDPHIIKTTDTTATVAWTPETLASKYNLTFHMVEDDSKVSRI